MRLQSALLSQKLCTLKGAVVGFGIVAYGASFIGFIALVDTVYPVMGYLGFTLIGAIIFVWVMKKRLPDKVGISK